MTWLLWLLLVFVSPAHAQCNGLFGGGTACGNSGAVSGPPGPIPVGPIVITPNQYGAVCDGVTDDHLAFQSAINQAQNVGGVFRFVGTCAITTGLTITSWLDFGGVGPIFSTIVSANGINAITINTPDQVSLHDFGIRPVSTPTIGATAITVTAPGGQENQQSWFWNIHCGNDWNCFNFVKASLWVLHDCQIFVLGGIGIQVANSNNPDSGDSSAYANVIADDTVGSMSTAGVQWTSSGGFRFSNNKILGFVDSFVIAEIAGATTEGPYIINNGFENFSSSAIHLEAPGAAGTLFFLKIDNNEFQSNTSSFILADTASAWLSAVTMNSNTIAMTSGPSTAVAYNLQTIIGGLTITGGVVQGNATTNIVAKLSTQTATNCVIGPITLNGTFSSNTLSSCTSISPN